MKRNFGKSMNRRQFQFYVLAIASGWLLAGCSPNEFSGSATKLSRSGVSGKLVLTGSSTIAPVIQEIASRFEQEHSDVRIDVQSGGSSRGIRDAGTGAADIGMSSRALKTAEAEKLDSHIIGWDGVAFVVHKNNPVETISDDQLRKIYTGAIANWSEVGGTDQRVVVSSRPEGRSELDLVCDYLNIKAGSIRANIVDGETQQSLKSVINNRKAITFTSVGAAHDAIKRGEPLKLLPLQGIQATFDNVQSGTFPLARPLVLVVPKNDKSKNDKLIKAFLKFSKSKSVYDAVVGLGFVPISK